MRTIREVHVFSQEELANLAKSSAKMAIMGGQLYIGTFDEQIVDVNADGSITVTTVHTPGTWEDQIKRVA